MYKIIHEIKKSIKIKQLKDLFRDDQVKNIETFHSNYLFTFAIEFILSGCLSIYLYKSSKYYNKNIENNVMSVPGGIKEKFELSSFLTKAVLFRCLTFIYFILFANRTSYDLISYVSFLFHIFPSFIFLMSLYLYIGFLIEKFYAISHKKIYVLTSLKYISYFSLLIIILLSLSVLVFKIYDESYFFIESLMCINFLIIGFLYAIYGRKITNFMNELNNIRTNNPIDMKSIRNSIHTKIICICIIICFSYIIFGVIKGLIAINFFGVWYPNFIDLNIYDSLQFLFCELLPSFIVGRKNKMWDSFKIEDLNNQQFMILEFEQRPLLNREESGNNLENGKTIEDKLDEILDKFDGKQTK